MLKKEEIKNGVYVRYNDIYYIVSDVEPLNGPISEFDYSLFPKITLDVPKIDNIMSNGIPLEKLNENYESKETEKKGATKI